MATSWPAYETAARAVVADLRTKLGVQSVEGKQMIPGASGTTWEIDGRAFLQGNSGYLVIEARRHTSSGQKQEDLAALAYRITDVGASGGIIVSPLPLQSGAQLVANHENIAHIRLDSSSTAEQYLAQFMGQTFHGALCVSAAHATSMADIEVRRGGKLIE